MSTDISREAAELLPCPFCGSTDLHETSNGVGNNFMECASCGCSGPPNARWNTRSDRATAALREENARLKRRLVDHDRYDNIQEMERLRSEAEEQQQDL